MYERQCQTSDGFGLEVQTIFISICTRENIAAVVVAIACSGMWLWMVKAPVYFMYSFFQN